MSDTTTEKAAALSIEQHPSADASTMASVSPLDSSMDGLIPVMLMMALGVFVYVAANALAILASPRSRGKNDPVNQLKEQSYECGEAPVGSAWSQFNVRFYVVGLIFIIFDVESVVMFPIAKIYKQAVLAGQGAYFFIIILAFVLVLVEGIAYCWKKGDLDWVKTYHRK